MSWFSIFLFPIFAYLTWGYFQRISIVCILGTLGITVPALIKGFF